MTDVPAAPVATGTPLQDASNLPDLSHQQAAQPDAAEVARKARRAQGKGDVRAAMFEQQAKAVRAAITRRAGQPGTRYLQQQQVILHCQ